MMLKQSNKEMDQLLSVTFLRIRVLCIHLLALKKQELKGLYIAQIVKTVHSVNLEMMSIMPLTISYINGVLRSCFRIQMRK